MNRDLLETAFMAVQSVFEEPVILADIAIRGVDWFTALEAMEDAITSGKPIEISGLFGDWTASLFVQIENDKTTKITFHYPDRDVCNPWTFTVKFEDGVATLL